jgi:hypothetical protein
VLQERVNEAQRMAIRELKEMQSSDSKGRRKRKLGDGDNGREDQGGDDEDGGAGGGGKKKFHKKNRRN